MPPLKPLSALACALLCSGAFAFDATPEATVAGFVKAWNSKDLAASAKRCVGGRGDANFSELYSILSKSVWPSISLSKVSIKRNGSSAAGTAHAVIDMGSQKQDLQDRFELRLIGKDWRIVPRKAADTTSQTVLSTLAQIVTFPETQQKMAASNDEAWCRSNLGQLTAAAMMLAAANKDVLKLDPTRAKAALTKYLSDPEVWRCHADKPGANSYTFNAKLAGMSLNKIKSPKTTVLFYEGTGSKLTFRHGGKMAVGFVDGHTELVTPERAKKLIWIPN